MNRRPLNKHLRVQVLARDAYRCLMCGRTSADVKLEVDHVVPVDAGGTDELHNLAALCRDCNAGKSAYRFRDYRQVTVVPPDVEDQLVFFHDPKTGHFERYHLYLYFKNGVHRGQSEESFHREWIITGSEFAASSDRSALEQRRRKEEAGSFITHIKLQLIAAKKQLVLNEEGLCRVDG